MPARPRILLIDDDAWWLEALAEFLSRHNIDVVATTDAAQALRLAEAGVFGLVLCDYEMPVLDGLQVLARLARRCQARVMLLSNVDEPGLARRVFRVGGKGLMSKSLPPEVLLKKIQELLVDSLPKYLSFSSPPLWQRLLPGPLTAQHFRTNAIPACISAP